MCPYCKKPILSARMTAIQIYESDGGTVNGIKYCCGLCETVLSLGVDPFSQVDEIVNQILAALGKKK